MIYFIKAKNYVKIGVSKNPVQRLKELQTANPIKLKLLGTIEGNFSTEAALHRMFYKWKKTGEWFFLAGHFKLCMIAFQDPFYKINTLKDLDKAGYELAIRQKKNRQIKRGNDKLGRKIRSLVR